MIPTLHLTNWSSKSLHGTGQRYTMMAAPRRWEFGDGAIADLTPTLTDLREVRRGEIAFEVYRDRFLALARGDLSPGNLRTADGREVVDGDTLLCACSRADAAAGRCHRVWAADLLVAAGWRVLLDGEIRGGPEETNAAPAWGVVGCFDGRTEFTPCAGEEEARALYGALRAGWSEVWLVRVVEGSPCGM